MVKVIGITGGIASGKSSVVKILKDMKLPVLVADDIVNNLYLDDKFIKGKISFLNSCIYKNKNFNKSELINFCKEVKNLEKVSTIIHPYVFLYCKKWISEREDEKFVFIEIPLLFKAKYEKIFDKIIYTFGDNKLRKRRLVIYRKYSEDKIDFFFSLQKKYEEYSLNMSYLTINNNKSIFLLKQKLKNIMLYL